MRKMILSIVLFCFAALSLLGLAGCAEKAETLAFGKDYYAVRVGETVVPEVKIEPQAAYTLWTAFDGVAKVEDGALIGVRQGRTVLVAVSGKLTASVTVEVLARDGTNDQPGEGKALVIYVVDERTSSYYTNYVKFGETTPDLILEKNGYSFHGWYSDANYNTPFDFSVPIAGETKIYGKYELVQGANTALTYTRSDDGYYLASGLQYPNVPYTEIEIPASAEVEGKTVEVAGIAPNGLQGLKSLTKISMPTANFLGDNALAGCPKLATVSANENLRYVGFGVLSGSKWLANEQVRRVTIGGKSRYHGAQLGNCYLYALPTQTEVWLTDSPKVTLFAGGSLATNANRSLHVPSGLVSYYREHPNLRSFTGAIDGY